MAEFNLKRYGITVEDVQRNLVPSAMYPEAIHRESDSAIADSGALIAYSGEKTGRSPKDKRVGKSAGIEHEIWWGSVNIPITPDTFRINLERAKDYLNTQDRA